MKRHDRKEPLSVVRDSGKRCIYCGFKLLHDCGGNRSLDGYRATVDHVIPSSKGGTDNNDNLKPCCDWCNSAKKDLTLEEFRSALKGNQHPMLMLNRYKMKKCINGKIYEVDWGGKFYFERPKSNGKQENAIDRIEEEQIRAMS